MASNAASAPAPSRFTLYRDRGRLAALWRKRRVRWPAYLLAAGLLGFFALWIVFVYGPRNTGEGAPPVDPSEEEEIPKHDR